MEKAIVKYCIVCPLMSPVFLYHSLYTCSVVIEEINVLIIYWFITIPFILI